MQLNAFGASHFYSTLSYLNEKRRHWELNPGAPEGSDIHMLKKRSFLTVAIRCNTVMRWRHIKRIENQAF